jgi:hypothetical protein
MTIEKERNPCKMLEIELEGKIYTWIENDVKMKYE